MTEEDFHNKYACVSCLYEALCPDGSFSHAAYLYEGAEGAVCGVVCYEESHVLVAQFHWSWTVHGGHCDL